MSARNGDKARFGKQRKRKMAHRARTQLLREGLTPVATAPADQDANTHAIEHAEKPSEAHPGVLDTAAGAIGSALGALAVKVTGVREPEPAIAD